MKSKQCGRCKEILPIEQFCKDKHRPDGLNNKCRLCCKEVYDTYATRVFGAKPFYENKKCSQYLGIHVAERVLSSVFKDVQRMPLHNNGFDFVCNKGFKVDCKASVTYNRTPNAKQWQFNIEHNEIADYFLCVAFDNRNDLNPIHIWLIPGKEIGHLQTASIADRTLHKWEQWEKPIDKVLDCCNTLKEG